MLKKLRLNKSLSQSQLAAASGIKLKMIQKYEQGVKDINHAKTSTLFKLCNTLECDLLDVVSDPELSSLIEIYENREMSKRC